MRIVIEVRAEPERPPTGTMRWPGLGGEEGFSGWVEMLRLLETAVRDPRAARQPASKRPMTPKPTA